LAGHHNAYLSNEACYVLAYKRATKGQHLISIHSTVSLVRWYFITTGAGAFIDQMHATGKKHVLIENISIYTPAGTKGLQEQKEA